MSKPDHLTLVFENRTVPREEAEEAGQQAYKFFYEDITPALNPLTLLSHAVRRYDDMQTLDTVMRKKLTDNGFLLHGENTPIKRRLRLPGLVAVSLVVPELEHGKVIGEYLDEPFKEVTYLSQWYEKAKRKEPKPGTRLSWIRDVS